MTAKEAAERLNAALEAAAKHAEVAASRMRAARNAEPKSARGVGRVPAKARTAPVRAELVRPAEVGTYTKPNGKKVKGNRAARRAAGQRGKAKGAR